MCFEHLVQVVFPLGRGGGYTSLPLLQKKGEKKT